MTQSVRLRPTVGKRYMALFKEFPIRPIRNEKEYDAAVGVMGRLAVRAEGSLPRDEQDYLDALTLLISYYDDKHYRVDTSTLAPVEILKFLMDQRGESLNDLVGLLGSKAAASYLYRGERNPSRAQCFLLAKHFGVDAGLFLANEAVPSKRLAAASKVGSVASKRQSGSAA